MLISVADSAITAFIWFARPKGQKTFEKEPDVVPIANKSRAPARAMTEPILKQNVPRIEQDLALIRRLLAFLANEIDFSPSLAFA